MKLADLRGRKRTLVAVSVVLIAFGWFLHPDSDATVGQFRSVAGRNEYVTHYQEAMRRFPTPPDMTADIDTDFGAVRVYEWHTPETKNSIPVVLIPGRSSGAPMWADNLAAFSSRHRVIAFDALGAAGLSVQAAPLADMVDQAAWIHQVLARQAPRGAHIVGHSFGGATAAAYAHHYPTEVRSLTLLEPVFTFSYPSARLMAWTMVASLPGLPTGWRNHALGRIGGTDYDPTEPMARMIDAGTHHYDAHLPTPSLLSDDDVHALIMPCYVAIASTDSLAGGDKAVRRAGELLPHARVDVWPDTTHSLPMQVAEPLGKKLTEFWETSS